MEQTEAVLGTSAKWLDLLVQYATDYGLKILAAIAIFIIGRLVVGIVAGFVRRMMARSKADETLTKFVVSLTRIGLLTIVIIAVLGALGIETASFVAVIGAAGLAVGFALQGSLSNFASGVMLIIFRPFKAGDYVEAGGQAGSVESIQIFNTIMKTPDNKKVIIPNSAVTGGNIVNYSAHETRRVDLVFGIGYGDDIKKAKTTLEQILAADSRILKDPAPTVAVLELADSSVNFAVRPWVNTADYWAVYFDLTEKVKLTFDEQGISIPFPQQDVHMHQATRLRIMSIGGTMRQMNASKIARTLTVTFAVAMLLTAAAHADDQAPVKGWKKSLSVDFHVTQAAYSDSWDGGEVGSFNWVSNLNGTAERQLSPKVNYATKLRLSFGQTSTQDEETKTWSKPKKSTDLIDWDNLFRFTFNGYVDPYAAFRVEGRFLDARVEQKKLYLTPLKLTESAGLARRFWERGEAEEITSRLGFAFRQNIRKDVLFADLVDSSSAILGTETNSETDGGIESVTDVVVQVNQKLRYTGKLTLYKALFFSEKDAVEGTEAEDDWKAVDVNWENIVDASLSKVISVQFYAQLLYDKEITSKVRVKETLGIGFTFNLI